MGPRLRRRRSLDAFGVKTPVTPVTFVDFCVEPRLTENTELLGNRIYYLYFWTFSYVSQL